ncbi:SLATT domain-containing protein [Streptomyces prunicolor]|uniref:SLATT domain-containing protein n=1 Tax=Streptomyces prunicolor TaxID=67348 RepID=A0ABU4FD15_9ACTN|nr:SLATT domain-containing protein [Streptomyces prunicolor]MCX5236127.1 SLATT domain-containing protein [Streptomyces prunicolor]MDV7218492.1 SLATT domain-containing protein [Streptomyces prunicolor]WSV14253.1 SLATT domain-containing protein [Streptomyces prunicolor]
MGQPEIQPEGGDLAGRTFPLGDWGEPTARLDELYRWVERGALETADRYLTERVWKRRGARVLRAGAALGAVTGVALPLLDLAGVAGGLASWGYLALLLGVACVAGDRFFGMTSGWMRDVATAQAVQRRLQALQFDWASEGVREFLGPAEGTASEAADRCLGVLRRFSEDVTELVRVETADWMVEFRTGSGPLGIQSAVVPGSRQEGTVVQGRFPQPPGPGGPGGGGSRPNMPRQRPPEPR